MTLSKIFGFSMPSCSKAMRPSPGRQEKCTCRRHGFSGCLWKTEDRWIQSVQSQMKTPTIRTLPSCIMLQWPMLGLTLAMPTQYKQTTSSSARAPLEVPAHRRGRRYANQSAMGQLRLRTCHWPMGQSESFLDAPSLRNTRQENRDDMWWCYMMLDSSIPSTWQQLLIVRPDRQLPTRRPAKYVFSSLAKDSGARCSNGVTLRCHQTSNMAGWEMPELNEHLTGKIIYKWRTVFCHVWLPEGN